MRKFIGLFKAIRIFSRKLLINVQLTKHNNFAFLFFTLVLICMLNNIIVLFVLCVKLLIKKIKTQYMLIRFK